MDQTVYPTTTTNYNFRRGNFEAMRADLDHQRLEHLIVNSDAAQGFELLKNKILESCLRQDSRILFLRSSPRNTLPSKTHHGATMMCKQSIARRHSDYDEIKRNNTDETSAEYFTARRGLIKRAIQQAKHNNWKSMLLDYAKLTIKASTPTSMREK